MLYCENWAYYQWLSLGAAPEDHSPCSDAARKNEALRDIYWNE